ncbi:MAG: hypothetical protein WD379_02285 [Dehalococcoidia bacterium]
MSDEPKRCASCDIELDRSAMTVEGIVYCCRGCAVGGPCVCSYVGDLSRYPRNGHGGVGALDLYGEAS